MPCGSLLGFPCVSRLNTCFTREPAPLPDFKCIQPGDVGYIVMGCFHLLFSAGRPLDGRELGIDVPWTFQQLHIGPTYNTQPRSPGYLSTNTVREIPARRTSTYPCVLLCPFPPDPQTCVPGYWNQILASRSNSQEVKALPF